MVETKIKTKQQNTSNEKLVQIIIIFHTNVERARFEFTTETVRRSEDREQKSHDESVHVNIFILNRLHCECAARSVKGEKE